MKFLIAGLGNIGSEYEHTRHNIGFDVLDALVKKHNGQFATDRLAMYAKLSVRGKQVHCIKPTTFMNLSGKSVLYWMTKLNIPVEHILVITDDLSLPLCRLRLRGKGSDAGHNGLKSIQESLNTDQYPRLRFGIGNQFAKGTQVQFVLGKWDAEEADAVNSGIELAVSSVEQFVLEGIERTMNKVNQVK